MSLAVRRSAVLACLLLIALPSLAARGLIIQDFESGSIVLDSYPGQDSEPGGWALVTDDTYEGNYALRLDGNTWKQEAIAPQPVLAGSVWQVAVKVDRIGEMQGFGVGDGASELFYSFGGEQLPEGSQWWTVYQGAHGDGDWHVYLLPIGEDWPATYGYLPTLDRLFYVNDNDDGGAAIVLFDAIVDVSADLPVAPTVDAWHEITRLEQRADGRWRAGVQFHSSVTDPDSPSHDYHWDFGDGLASSETDPFHEFIVTADHFYAVGLDVTDPEGMAGGDTCQVAVEPGGPGLPIEVNFVGDIMIGRSYESPGGIIDDYGVDAIFAPTKPIFADAADLSCCNLEVPFTDQGEPHPTKSVVFRARPENFVGVVNAGIDLCDLGNNHIVDYGEPGLLQTRQLCADAGILHFGAGRNDREALAPAFVTEQGIRLAFLGLSNRTGRRWNYQPFLDAGASKPGFGYLIPKNLNESIAASRDLADILIVQTHSGNEYETQGAPNEGEPGGACPGTPFENSPPPVEAAEIGPDDPDFRFRNEPTPSERELRRQSLDLGADILINHHPHVLQGFEVHDGKLIAHSLGNFIFDLYYPETMPTLVLTLEIEKTGITGYTLVPAWIDDYITQPATGALGRAIMDMLADYSRDMGALVAVDPFRNMARIHLDPAEAPTMLGDFQVALPMREESGFALSRPHEHAGPGSLSLVLSASGDGLGDWEIRFGRELLWHGGFEAEGATFWDDNSADEWLDETESQAGQRSLALRRDNGAGAAVGTDLERHLPCDPAKAHSFLGWMKGIDAEGANILARFYPDRYAGSPVSSTALGPDLSGSGDWSQQWAELETPENGGWFELRCTLDPPGAAAESRAWFDELKFVEWEPWQPGQAGLPLPHPNNLGFVQIRSTNSALDLATLLYRETAFAQDLTTLPASTPAPAGRLAQNYPNPFNPSTRIELSLPASAPTTPVHLAIYDLRGRRLVTLFEGSLSGGESRIFDWQGRDAADRALPSGVYFSRARFGDRRESRKMILLR